MAQKPARILVIDDEESIRRLLMDYAEDFDDLAVRASESGEAALEELARQGADLCVADMRLPGMDGQAFIIQAHDRGLCPRFLLHTGSLDFALGQDLLERGVTEEDVFHKPCDMAKVVARIRAVLGLAEGGEG